MVTSRSVSLSKRKGAQQALQTSMALIVVASCVVAPPPKSDEEIQSERLAKAKIALPAEAPNTNQNNKRANELLSQIPEEGRDSQSEIDLPADSLLPSTGTMLSSDEQRRREFKARRTDTEIIGSQRSMDDRRRRSLGEIDRNMGVAATEAPDQSPSFILGLQRIRDLFKERLYEESLIEVNDLLRTYPRSAQLLTMKGTLHQHLTQFDLALGAYRRAYEYEPSQKLKAQIDWLQNTLMERARLMKESREIFPEKELTPSSDTLLEPGSKGGSR